MALCQAQYDFGGRTFSARNGNRAADRREIAFHHLRVGWITLGEFISDLLRAISLSRPCEIVSG
jgi:hypothetical protein